MTTLNDDPGRPVPVGVVPSPLDERRKDRWLVFGPTFVFACLCNRADDAVALVLVRLGYANRPELAHNLTARHATDGEIAALCVKRRTSALRVNHRNQPEVHRVAAALRRADSRKFDL